MKYTLLQLTQSILRSIKGEAVDSISDTQESLDVVDIIKECYYTIIAEIDLPEVKTLFQLNASGDNTKPVLMTVPDDVYSLEWLDYNALTLDDPEDNYRRLTPVTLETLMAYTNNLNTDEDYVSQMALTFNSDTMNFKFRSDQAPQYYATIDDNQIVFDAYDSEVDTTLQKTKTRGYGIRMSDWEDDDDFVPNIDAHQFQILLKTAKAMAWQEMKSIENVSAQRDARRLMIAAKVKRNRVNQKEFGYYYNYYPNYGRK